MAIEGEVSSNRWSQKELDSCVRCYLWMLRGHAEGYTAKKARVRRALLSGPLEGRSEGSIEYRFQNISAALQKMGEGWLPGYLPAKNVGSNVLDEIQGMVRGYRESRSLQWMSWMVDALPVEVVQEAVKRLLRGEEIDYADSTGYDVLAGNEKLPPKKVTGFAGLLFFGVPLYHECFSGGLRTACFKKMEEAGYSIQAKSEDGLSAFEPESVEFRKKVAQHRKVATDRVPAGNQAPKSIQCTVTRIERDPQVVAAVERRANGICERCGKPAPFLRPNGEPFLEVHHVEPLAEGGPDTVDNAVAICPNCHRECHYGANAGEIRFHF